MNYSTAFSPLAQPVEIEFTVKPHILCKAQERLFGLKNQKREFWRSSWKARLLEMENHEPSGLIRTGASQNHRVVLLQ